MRLAEDFKKGEMPAIQEVHSAKFPMYADMDFKIPLATLEDDTIRRIASILNREISRCFPGQTEGFRCVICTKSKGSVACGTDLFKHGMHFHWPCLIVYVETALTIRERMVWALEREAWGDALGPGFDASQWDDILDKAVYSLSDRHGGLRLVGAPKAKKCTSCVGRRKGELCHECRFLNNYHILDDNVYVLFEVMVDDRVEPERTRKLQVCPVSLFRDTSVRCDNPDVSVVTGWDPNIPIKELKLGAKGKVSVAGTPSRGKTAMRGSVVSDTQMQTIMRKQLVRHSDKYTNSKMLIKCDVKGVYRVQLTQEGSHYCLNKKGAHGSQHVYMEVFQTAGTSWASHMRCFCTKPLVQPESRKTCREFKSQRKAVDWGDVDRLVAYRVDHAPPSAQASSSKNPMSFPVDSAAAAEAASRSRQQLQALQDAKRKREEQH